MNNLQKISATEKKITGMLTALDRMDEVVDGWTIAPTYRFEMALIECFKDGDFGGRAELFTESKKPVFNCFGMYSNHQEEIIAAVTKWINKEYSDE